MYPILNYGTERTDMNMTRTRLNDSPSLSFFSGFICFELCLRDVGKASYFGFTNWEKTKEGNWMRYYVVQLLCTVHSNGRSHTATNERRIDNCRLGNCFFVRSWNGTHLAIIACSSQISEVLHSQTQTIPKPNKNKCLRNHENVLPVFMLHGWSYKKMPKVSFLSNHFN